MFELKNVTKQFNGEYALKGVSCRIGSGLNFIVGASGSGKTTLLKILTGMEQDYGGDAFYMGQPLKALTAREKCGYYGDQFGFVCQDFNLLDDRSVLENVMLPQHINGGADERAAMKLLRQLGIADLAAQKAGKLSGGQKQRVAIARKLAKGPAVILADEPTSALDEKSAKAIMRLLREIAKKRCVIVVTHDVSLIREGDRVYELDKGELVSCPEPEEDRSAIQPPHAGKLAGGSAWRLALSALKSRPGRTLSSALAVIVSATLLLVTLSGAIAGSGESAFQKLYDTYGESILEISVVKSFMSAGGSGGYQPDGPSADVEQNIDGLYERYAGDSRVEHIVFSQAYDDISVTVDGKSYEVESSNSVPYTEELVAGEMPMGDGYEIVVPESFAKRLGVPAGELLGKSVEFSGSIYNWDSGEPVSMPVSVTATIVGVMDTSVRYDYEGQVMTYTVDDAFFFSKSALDEMRRQAGIEGGESNFVLRAKTPEDMIAIKDELNAQGIVPLGRFELVEDMVRLNQQTAQQSGSATVVIAILVVVVDLAVAAAVALSRRREYAIFQVNGHASSELLKTVLAECTMLGLGSALIFLCLSPVISLGTSAAWGVGITDGRLLGLVAALNIAAALLGWAVCALSCVRLNAAAILKTGER